MRDVEYHAQVKRDLADRYEIVNTIGEGVTSVIWEATQIRTGAPVALKLLREEYCGSTEAQMAIQREGELLSAVRHGAIGPPTTFLRNVTITNYVQSLCAIIPPGVALPGRPGTDRSRGAGCAPS